MTMDRRHLENIASRMLLDLGVDPALLGFRNLRTALCEIVLNPGTRYAMTTELYPKVAAIHETTWTRVERTIRHSIEMLFTNGDVDVIARYFGNSVRSSGVPTTGTFISVLAEHMQYQIEYFEKHEAELDFARLWPAGLEGGIDHAAT